MRKMFYCSSVANLPHIELVLGLVAKMEELNQEIFIFDLFNYRHLQSTGLRGFLLP